MRVAAFILFASMIAASARADDGVVKGKVSFEGDYARPAFVYVEDMPASPAPTAHVVIAQEGSHFKPDTAVAVVGQTVDFPNNDKHYHNVFSVTPGDEFDLGLYRAGQSKSAVMKTAGDVVIYCNIHPDMIAHLLVLPNTHYAEISADGSYELKGVSPGAHKITAWSGTHVPQTVTVTVKAGASVDAPLSLKKRASQAHLNKDGEQYGRYH